MSNRLEATCLLKLNVRSFGWEKALTKMLRDTNGITSFNINAVRGTCTITGKFKNDDILDLLGRSDKQNMQLFWVQYGDGPYQAQNTCTNYAYSGGNYTNNAFCGGNHGNFWDGNRAHECQQSWLGYAYRPQQYNSQQQPYQPAIANKAATEVPAPVTNDCKQCCSIM